MPSNTTNSSKDLFLLFRSTGQIDALERSLEGDAECRAILQQIA
ncbi:metal-sensing transcriptional repressor, partial [Escherichia sp. TWPC-MK]